MKFKPTIWSCAVFFAYSSVFSPIEAQNWKPVLSGKTQYFIGPEVNGSDSIIWSFQTIFSHVQGLDSVFAFNPIIRYNDPFPSYWDICNGDSIFINWNSNYDLRFNQPNIAGVSMTATSPGGFAFDLKNGDQIWLHPTFPLGMKWQYQSNSSDSAWVVSRTQLNILGVLDSAAEISVTNGHSYFISKNHGFIDWYFHDPIKEEDGTVAIENGIIFGIPEMGLGRTVPSFMELTDLDVGDKFVINDFQTDLFYFHDRYDFHTVTSVSQSSNQAQYQTIMERTENGSTLPPTADQLFFSKTPIFDLLPGEAIIDTGSTGSSQIHGNYHAYYKKLAAHNGRIAMLHRGVFFIDICYAFGAASSYDFEEFVGFDTYVAGLGLMNYEHGFTSMYQWFHNEHRRDLVCYQKVGEPRHGPCDSQFNYVGITDPVSQPLFSLYPNPANQYVVLNMEMDLPDAYSLTLTDVLGSTVWQLQSSDQQVTIPTDAFPAGVYFISVEDGDGNSAVKRFFIAH